MTDTKPAAPSERTRVRRMHARADYRATTVDAILDEAYVAHLGFSVDGQPFVIPTLHARVGRQVYVHGSSASRTMRLMAGAAPVCLTVTLLDGLVLARSAINHSMNYRSVAVFGEAHKIDAEQEKLLALEAFTERVIPGRWNEIRKPSRQELKATSILALNLDEASAKARTGGPVDEKEDYALDVWAGHIPLALTPGPTIVDPLLRDGIEPSPSLQNWLAEQGRRGDSEA